MRAEAGRDPHDRGLQDLVGELSTRSETFRRLWGAHDVRTHGAGTKRFHHPVVGELTLAYEELAITAEPGLVLMVYTAEPGSPSAERLRLLASWAAPAPIPATPTRRRTLMQITRSSIDTVHGPGDWFTGDVYIDAVAAAPPPSRVTANLVHFMPGARTHWHRHPLSQTVFVTEGAQLGGTRTRARQDDQRIRIDDDPTPGRPSPGPRPGLLTWHGSSSPVPQTAWGGRQPKPCSTRATR